MFIGRERGLIPTNCRIKVTAFCKQGLIDCVDKKWFADTVHENMFAAKIRVLDLDWAVDLR